MKRGIVRGTYWGISTHIRDYQLEANGCEPSLLDDNKIIRSLSRMRTRLNRFSADEQERLINWDMRSLMPPCVVMSSINQIYRVNYPMIFNNHTLAKAQYTFTT
jgi:ADP-glucose pyrophosphorylase